MQYKKTNFEDGRVYVTSILSGMDKPRRLVAGKIIESHNNDPNPLVRVYSVDKRIYTEGLYGIAVREEERWEILDHRFSRSSTAEKFIPGLHLIYDEVAVVQFWHPTKQPWTGLSRDDPTEIREDTGEI